MLSNRDSKTYIVTFSCNSNFLDSSLSRHKFLNNTWYLAVHKEPFFSGSRVLCPAIAKWKGYPVPDNYRAKRQRKRIPKWDAGGRGEKWNMGEGILSLLAQLPSDSKRERNQTIFWSATKDCLKHADWSLRGQSRYPFVFPSCLKEKRIQPKGFDPEQCIDAP